MAVIELSKNITNITKKYLKYNSINKIWKKLKNTFIVI